MAFYCICLCRLKCYCSNGREGELCCVVYARLWLLRKVFSKGSKAVLVGLVVHPEIQSFRADKPVEPPLYQDVLTILLQREPCLFLCYGIRRLKPVVIYTLPPMERKTAMVIGCCITFSNGYWMLYYIQPRTIRRERLQARQRDLNTRIEDLKY